MSGEDDPSGWNLTESDPGVFSELLKTLGIPYIVDDVHSLDSESLAQLQPIYALIFLFKWVSPMNDPASSSGSSPGAPSSSGQLDYAFPGFFAHQVVNNACATLAVLNAILNVPSLTTSSSSSSTLHPELQNLISFTTDMDATTRGLALTSSEFLREAHNSLSPPNAVDLAGLDDPREKEKGDAYHFVGYLPVVGAVYELDGLKEAPVRHGEVDESAEEGWIAKARQVILDRIATYPPGSLEFNLLAIHDDPLPSLQSQLSQLQSIGDASGAAEVLSKIEAENDKRARWAFENSLRRHNHVGLIHSLLLALAKAGTLDSATEKAKEKMKERVAKAQKQKQKQRQEQAGS